MNKTEKEIIITEYLDSGNLEVDVNEVEGLCCAFTGLVCEGGVKTDTDGSKYVTVSDLEGNYYDVDISKIDLP
tara:strand:+ start:199 stop:417 length:219 start_codon:yes stop_codon:yes gene_type:complete